MMARLIPALGIAALAVSLAACGGKDPVEKKVEKYEGTGGLNLAKLVGTTKNPPDEFAVIAADPLEMPKDFAALPSPDLGARSPRMPDAQVEARTLLLGNGTAPQAANARTSVSEAALLSASGRSDPNIRTVLESEQAEYEAEQDLYVLDDIIPALKGLRKPEVDENRVVPMVERDRLASASVAPRTGASGIATIPSVGSAPIAVQPVTTVPIESVPGAASTLVTVDPVTGGELIYIPE